jgi:hypothetical protein
MGRGALKTRSLRIQLELAGLADGKTHGQSPVKLVPVHTVREFWFLTFPGPVSVNSGRRERTIKPESRHGRETL